MRESVNQIRISGAIPCGVIIALDRMERGNEERSATQEIHHAYGIQVASIVDLDDITSYLRDRKNLGHYLRAIESYRAQYGVA